MNKPQYHILLMPGEGIGPEVIAEGERVLRAVVECYELDIVFSEHCVGVSMFQQCGKYLSEDTERICDELQRNPHAGILFGAVADEPIGILRKRYDLFANIRPIRLFPQAASISPLRAERLRNVDMLIVRELVSGIYYGDTRTGCDDQGRWAAQEMYYHEDQIRRITRRALTLAQQRRKRLHLVHKGNVIQGVFALWHAVLKEEAPAYPDIECRDILVDTMAMHMVLRPHEFDVLLCSNMFGDILSDLGGAIIGSIGLLPSASVNAYGFGLFEPVGGTAPDIAGTQTANPLAAILSAAMLCRQTLAHEEVATAIETAVDTVLRRYRTVDMFEDGYERVSTAEMGALVVSALRDQASKGGRSCSTQSIRYILP